MLFLISVKERKYAVVNNSQKCTISRRKYLDSVTSGYESKISLGEF